MLHKIGFKELASEKTLTVEVIDQDRVRFFMLNHANEARIHVDVDSKEAQQLAQLLTENFGSETEVTECESEPMLPAGEWEQLASVQRNDVYAMKDRMLRHLNAEVEAFYREHPEIKVSYHFQVEVVRR